MLIPRVPLLEKSQKEYSLIDNAWFPLDRNAIVASYDSNVF